MRKSYLPSFMTNVEIRQGSYQAIVFSIILFDNNLDETQRQANKNKHKS